MFRILGKSKPEIPALFLSGKQRNIHSSTIGFTRWYITTRPCITAEEKDHKPEINMHYATAVGVHARIEFLHTVW